MQSVIEQYYSINKYFLMSIGLWPKQTRFIRAFRPSVLFGLFISIAILAFARFLETWRDMSMACESIILILTCTGGCVKLFTAVLQNHNIQQLFSLIEYHWCLFTHSMEIEILRHYAVKGRKMTIIYAVSIYTMMSFYVLIPVIPKILDLIVPINGTRTNKFMFDIYYSFDRDDYYYVVLLHTYVAVIVGISMMITIDTMYIVYAQHGCSLFAAVGYRIEHVTSSLQENNTVDPSKRNDSLFLTNAYANQEGKIYQELIHCLRKHQLSIEYIKLLDSSFGLYSFMLLFLNLIITSLLGLQVITLRDHKEDMIRYASMALGGFTHLFILNFPGEKVMNHSVQIFYKAYNIEWYRLSRKSTQLLSILLSRSMVPCTLTACNVIVLSLANYASILQMSLSYFTTLSSVR